MNKLKVLRIINITINIIIVIIDIILGIVFNFSKDFYISTVLFTALIGLVNLIFIAVKEVKVITYDSKRYDPMLNTMLTIIGAVAFYLVSHLNHYNEYIYLYWIVFIILIIIDLIVSLLLNKKNPKIDKPKILINK